MDTPKVLYAHIFKQGKLYKLVITRTPSLAENAWATLSLASKAACKRVAAEHYKATPWNY